VHDRQTGELAVNLAPAAGERVWLWTVRSRAGDDWNVEVLPGSLRVHRLGNHDVREVIVTAVSRTGVESLPATIRR
jgi:hypothetical protein